jgi:hypothetical protein
VSSKENILTPINSAMSALAMKNPPSIRKSLFSFLLKIFTSYYFFQ